MLQRAALLILVAFVTLLHLAACGGGSASQPTPGEHQPQKSGKLMLVATTPMVADVVKHVAGEHMDVVALIAPGVDPHLWTPTRTDTLKVLEADAVFLNGLMLEGRAGDSFARVEQMGRPVLRIAQTLDRKLLLTDPKRASYFDPHVWMDPTLWGRTAAPVADVLASLDPAHAADFRANAKNYEAAAAKVDHDVELMIAAIPLDRRTLVSAHDAFSYFGRRFGLDVRGIQGISTESEASIADIESLVADIAQKKVPAVFIETTVSERTVRALVEGSASLGHELKIGDPLFSDSLGREGSAESTWEGMLRYNARTISQSLGGSR